MMSCSPAKEGCIEEACRVDSQQLVPDWNLPKIEGLKCRPDCKFCSIRRPEVLPNLLLYVLRDPERQACVQLTGWPAKLMAAA